MNKQEFLKALKKELSSLKRQERAEQLRFYSEMIDDRMEEGMSEREAVSSIGDAKEVAAQILGEASLPLAKAQNQKRLKSWEILVLVLGSPLWIALLLALGAVVLSIFVVLWSLVLAAWAVALPFMVFGYIAKYLFIACKEISKLAFALSKKCIIFTCRFFGKGKR